VVKIFIYAQYSEMICDSWVTILTVLCNFLVYVVNLVGGKTNSSLQTGEGFMSKQPLHQWG